MKIFNISIFLILCIVSFAQTPQERVVDWSNAGLITEIDSEIETVNVNDFGAVVNDDNSDLQALQDAIAYFEGEHGKILFGNGIYDFEASIIIPSGIIIEGSGSALTTLRCDLNIESNFIVVSGNLSATTDVVIHALKGENYIVLESVVTEFAVGDVIKLQMDGEPFMTSDWALQTMGQIVQIESIVEDTLFLTNSLRHNFDSENNPFVVKINPVQDVLIKSLKILRVDQTSSQTNNITFNYAFNCSVRDIESENCNFAHISFRSSINCVVSGCYLHHAHAYGEGGQGYGTEVSSTSSDCLIHNNIYEHLRHSVLLQTAANGNVIAYNYSFDPYWDQGMFPSASAGDLVMHGNYAYCNLFEGNIAQNVVIDDSHGKNGPYNTFFRNRLEKYGVVMNFNPATDSCNLIGNEITNTGFLLGNYTLYGSGHYEYGNNHTGDCTPSGTTDLSENSLFLENAPCYFYDEFDWPGIGYPVAFNVHVNPAYSRYNEGQMTFDTCETIISSLDIADAESSLFYPNPTSGSIFILNPIDVQRVCIYNVNGKQIECFDTEIESQIELGFAPGIYVLQIVYKNNSFKNQKLFIQ